MPNLATVFDDYYNNPSTFFKSEKEENVKRETFAKDVERMALELGAKNAYGNKGAAIGTMLDNDGLREAFSYAREHRLAERARDAAPGFDLRASLPRGYTFSARMEDGVMTYVISTNTHSKPNHVVTFTL